MNPDQENPPRPTVIVKQNIVTNLEEEFATKYMKMV